MTDLRFETAADLIHACTCYERLKKALPTCANEQERARMQEAIDEFEESIKRLGERMLQFAASGYSSALAHERQARRNN